MRQAKEASAEPRRGYEVTCRLVQQFNFLSIHVRSLHGVLTPDKGRANAFQLQHLYVGISTSLREDKVPGPAANFSIGSDSLGRTGSYLPLFCLVASSSPPSCQ